MTYLLYAIGEIILVVVGILIALGIDTTYNHYQLRSREKEQLTNIKRDLQLDLINIEENLTSRMKKIKGGKKLLSLADGEPIEDMNELNDALFYIISETIYQPNNITVSELINSGELNLIRDDSIKNLILNLQFQYNNHEDALEHERFDYREFISKPFFENMRFSLLAPKFAGTAVTDNYSQEEIATLLSNKSFINGCQLSVVINESYFTNLLKQIQQTSILAIELIEKNNNQ